MKKDYVISKIEASQDGAPYVYIALSDPNDLQARRRKTPKSFWSKHDGIYFTRGSDEKFTKSDVKYFLGPWVEAACQRIPLHSKSV